MEKNKNIAMQSVVDMYDEISQISGRLQDLNKQMHFKDEAEMGIEIRKAAATFSDVVVKMLSRAFLFDRHDLM